MRGNILKSSSGCSRNGRSRAAPHGKNRGSRRSNSPGGRADTTCQVLHCSVHVIRTPIEMDCDKNMCAQWNRVHF
jgi:hypothetical protein